MRLQTSGEQNEVSRLREQVEALRSELDRQRDELGRELVRRAYRIGKLEDELAQSRGEYEASFSWRVTKPLRVGKALLRELRRR